MLSKIIVKGAREHNLKNIEVEIPRDKFVVITGLSGSGKSTLAFDTIYAEGQRRYVESLSSYARQFLGMMNKPDIDSIEGLSPAISIEQKTTSKNPRSTVGTVTEIYDYLRLLFARVGTAHCPRCKEEIKPQSAQNIVNYIMTEKNKQIIILAPVIRGIKGTHEKVILELIQDGFTKARVDGKISRLNDLKNNLDLERYEKHWIEAVIDNIEVNDDNRSRITEAVEQALHKSDGTVTIIDANQKITGKEIERSKYERVYSSHGACPNHPEVVFEELEPRMFSFNSPFGACSNCLGLGQHLEVDPQRIIPDPSKSIMGGAIEAYGKGELSWRMQQLAVVGKVHGFNMLTPVEKFGNMQLDILLYGSQKPIEGKWSGGTDMHMKNGWEGLIPQIERLHRTTESNYRKEKFEKFMVSRLCQTCKGKRLKETMLAVTVGGHSIIDVTDMNIKEAIKFFEKLKLTQKEKIIAEQILKEIVDRLGFLNNVGLSYLTLSRSARTLSGGEAQRIRLATQIGANLMGVLYILDEPSIGLHQRDNAKLINTLHKLRNLGNTLIVVEHDEDTIRAADYVLDIGPGAGVHGGHICAQGTPKQITEDEESLTGQYLSGKKRISVPKLRRQTNSFFGIKGASENNLRNLDIALPTGVLCGITGVSGSGKSTLMSQTVIPALQKHFGMKIDNVGKYKDLLISGEVNSVIIINQEPIGRTPRSNPATYTKLFDEIREIFANNKEARKRGYKAGRFSFNIPGGRCETCKGDGLIKIEMNFLPDVYVECEDCKGRRYNDETLEVTFKNHTIAEILAMDVESALKLFENYPNIKRKLQTLFDVGLGYLKLGQSAATLSGGESQRIKLTRELAKMKRGKTLYLLDEPTTGLHFEDVRKLLLVLNRLVDKGNSVFVIEHNLDVIKCCDYLIDLGPEGGDGGGEVVAKGTPEQVVQNPKSYTGQFLRPMLE